MLGVLPGEGGLWSLWYQPEGLSGAKLLLETVQPSQRPLVFQLKRWYQEHTHQKYIVDHEAVSLWKPHINMVQGVDFTVHEPHPSNDNKGCCWGLP